MVARWGCVISIPPFSVSPPASPPHPPPMNSGARGVGRRQKTCFWRRQYQTHVFRASAVCPLHIAKKHKIHAVSVYGDSDIYQSYSEIKNKSPSLPFTNYFLFRWTFAYARPGCRLMASVWFNQIDIPHILCVPRCLKSLFLKEHTSFGAVYV